MGRLTSAFLSSSSLSRSLMSICCEASLPSSPHPQQISIPISPCVYPLYFHIYSFCQLPSCLSSFFPCVQPSLPLSLTFLSDIFPAYPPLFLPFISLFFSFIIPSLSLCFTRAPLHLFRLLLSEVIHIFPMRETHNDRESRRENETQE